MPGVNSVPACSTQHGDGSVTLGPDPVTRSWAAGTCRALAAEGSRAARGRALPGAASAGRAEWRLPGGGEARRRWPGPRAAAFAVFTPAGGITLPTADTRENPEKEMPGLHPQTSSLF